MKQRRLGRTDLQVSELCLDASAFGWRTEASPATAILDCFHQSGGNFIQTHATGGEAPGSPAAPDIAEAMVGRWIRDRHVPRTDLVLATSLTLGPQVHAQNYGKLAAALRTACETALHSLNTPYLDLLILEWSDTLPMAETLAAAETLLRVGMFRYLGCNNFPAWRAMEWIAHSARRQVARLEVMQVGVPFPSEVGSWREARDLARQHRLGLVVRPPFHGAARSSRHGPPALRPTTVCDHGSAELARMARERNTDPRAVALTWALADPSVSSALVQAATPAELEAFLVASQAELSIRDILRVARPERARSIPGLQTQNTAPDISASPPSPQFYDSDASLELLSTPNDQTS